MSLNLVCRNVFAPYSFTFVPNMICMGFESLDDIFVCLSLAYGKVFLVRKNSGHDAGQLYAMKVRRGELNVFIR